MVWVKDPPEYQSMLACPAWDIVLRAGSFRRSDALKRTTLKEAPLEGV